MAKLKKPNAIKRDSATRSEEAMQSAVADGHNIRSWREFRGIATQGDLAAMTKARDPANKGLSRACICRLESGAQQYSQVHIAAIAGALSVDPRDLIGTNPYNSGDIFAVYAGLPEADKRRALKLLRDLQRKPPRS